MLHDMSERFEDLISMEIPDWVINRFADTEEVGAVEEELTELQNGIELKSKFKKSYHEFLLQKEISDCCRALWAVVKKLLVAFPKSCLVERGFSVAIQRLSKLRNLFQIIECGDLRVLPVAVPWLRSLVASLSPWRPGFAPGAIRMGFVVDKVALGQIFLRVLRFSPVNIIPPSLSKLISSGECVIC
jgi:hypothetical protein